MDNVEKIVIALYIKLKCRKIVTYLKCLVNEKTTDTLLHQLFFNLTLLTKDYLLTSSFKALPGLNFGAFAAAIFIVSPV